MTNLLQKFENAQIEKLSKSKDMSDFRAGDIIKVRVKISDGDGKSDRIQVFEGLCIGRKNRSMASSFTVRKISHGEGVERIFPLYSPRIDGVEIVRKGAIRRAKLYYMRDLTGKAARIKERIDVISGEGATAELDAEALAKIEEQKAKKKAEKAAKKASHDAAAKTKKKK